MSDDENDPLPESFSEGVKALVDDFVAKNGEPSVAVIAFVRKGEFGMQAFVHSDRPDLYQMLGMMDQLRVDILSSVPENRPLREPYGDDDIELELDFLPGPISPDEPS